MGVSSAGCKRNNIRAMQIQRGNNYFRRSVYRSCTYERIDTTQNQHFKLRGVSEKQKYTNAV